MDGLYVKSLLLPAGLLLVLLRGQDRNILSSKRPALIVFGIVVLFATGFILTHVHALEDPAGFTRYMRWVLSRCIGPCGLMYIAYALLNTPQRIHSAIEMYVYVIGISAVIAIGQFANIGAFWELRFMLPVHEEDAEQVYGQLRPLGLADYVVPLGYQLAVAVPLVLAIGNGRTRFKVLLGVLACACLFCGQRSAMLSAILGSLIVRPPKFKLSGTIAVLASVAVLGAIGFYFRDRDLLRIDDTVFERVDLAHVGLKVIAQNPFGIGLVQKEEWGDIVFKSAPQIASGNYVTQVLTPHNQFLNTMMFFGIQSFMLLGIVYLTVIRELRKNMVGHFHIAYLCRGLLAAVAAYVTNSLAHNNGLFLGDVLHWLVLGIALGAIDTAARWNRPLPQMITRK